MKIGKIKHKIDFSKVIENGDDPSFYLEITKNIIHYIKNNGNSTFQEIIKYVGGSDRRIIRLLDQMVKTGMLKFSNKKGFYLVENTDTLQPRVSNVRCATCHSKLIDINGALKPVINFMNEILKERPKPTFILDQRPVNLETIVRRVGYLIMKGDAQGKKIAFVGDDDLTSVALAKIKLAKEIAVFDIDERILNSIKRISDKHNLNIKVVKQDLLQSLPKKYTHYFDVFVTDPTPTFKPLVLFTNRGLEMLKKAKGMVGYISLYPSHMKKSIDFQKALGKMGLLITDLIPAFNEYEFLEFTYSHSDLKLLENYTNEKPTTSFCEHLMRIETTNVSKPITMKISALDLMGRATKRVLKDPNKDPVLGDKQTECKSIMDLAAKLKKLYKEGENA